MVFLRAIARGLLLLIILASLSAWISTATLQATLLNRQQVKDWLSQSGAYDKLLGSLVDVELQRQTQDETLVDTALLQQALEEAFPPAYVQDQTEIVLDASYDWLEGERPAITFSIDTAAKRDSFEAHLAGLLQSKVAELPLCTSQSQLALNTAECLPPGATPQSVADRVARQTADQSQLFEEPITERTFGAGEPGVASNNGGDWLKYIAGYAPVAAILLPPVILIVAAIYVLLSSSRLKGLAIIGRRACFTALIFGIAGGLLWYFGRSIEFGSALTVNDPQGSDLAQDIIGPLLQIVVPGVGQWMVIFSSIPVIIGAGIWLTAWLVRRKKEQRIQAAHVHVPVAPTNPADTHNPDNKPPAGPSYTPQD